MRIVKYTALILASGLALVLILIGVLSITRGTPVKTVIAEGDRGGPPEVRDPLFPRTIELFTGTHIDPGNNVQVLLNGDGTYPFLWKDIASAKRTVTVELYYSQPGAVADTIAKYLEDRARAHVRVLVLLDAFGSQPLKPEWIDRLKKAGVEFAWLRPLRWYSLHKATQRSHVRAIVIDGRVGYTGGFGLADYWLGDGHHDDQWRETNVRFEGPSVAALQAAFASAWAEGTGELITGDMFFPADDFSNLLIKAARHGVDVRVLTVSAKTDVKTTWYAGRALYEKLLSQGVRIYEYQPTMMHAKTIVVDGLFSAIGSMNFDNRSLAFNNESQLLSLDSGVGQRMDSVFMDDIKYSEEMKLDTFRRRPWTGKVLEWGAQKLRRLL